VLQGPDGVDAAQPDVVDPSLLEARERLRDAGPPHLERQHVALRAGRRQSSGGLADTGADLDDQRRLPVEPRRPGEARLLDRLVEEARTAGVRELISVVADDSPASLALHRSRGFREAGRLTGVGFKLGRWVDTTLLQRSLATG